MSTKVMITVIAPRGLPAVICFTKTTEMRKGLLAIMAVLFVATLLAQVPQKMNYQAVVRDNAGQPAISQPVELRFTIHNGTPSGPSVYTETSNLTSNTFGLVTTEIGTNANLSVVNWGNGPKFLQVEAKVNNAATFTDMGTSPLVSVPYAQYSQAAQVADTVLHLPTPPTPAAKPMISVYDVYAPETISSSAAGTNMRWVDGTQSPLSIVDSAFTLHFDTVTINVAGRYKVTYEVTLENTNGGSTGNSAAIWVKQTYNIYLNGTASGIYLGTTTGALGNASRSVTYDFTAGLQLWINVQQIAGDGTISTLPHGSAFRIEKLD